MLSIFEFYFIVNLICLKVFIGKIPREVFEDELIPICEEAGKIWDLRLMIDPVSGFNKGYCFVTYCAPGESAKACERVSLSFQTFNKYRIELFSFSSMVMLSVQENF